MTKISSEYIAGKLRKTRLEQNISVETLSKEFGLFVGVLEQYLCLNVVCVQILVSIAYYC